MNGIGIVVAQWRLYGITQPESENSARRCLGRSTAVDLYQGIIAASGARGAPG